jgi:hypothetical protein
MADAPRSVTDLAGSVPLTAVSRCSKAICTATGKVSPGSDFPEWTPLQDAGRSLQLEKILQEGLNVLMGFVRRRLLVEAARKSFFITSIAWRKRLLRFAV